MSKAFKIPTVRKYSIFKKFRCISIEIDGHSYALGMYEYYQAFNLPIIKGNPFVKVNAN